MRDAAHRDRLAEQAGQQELQVVVLRAAGDRAAEHVENSSRKMIGCSVTSMSCSGVRVILIRLRLASTSACRSCARSRVAVGCRWRPAARSAGRGRGRHAAPPRRRSVRVPVRVKNTSSRLGRCSESSSTAIPAARSRATTSGSTSSPSTGTVSRAAPVGSSGAGAGDAGAARRAASSSRAGSAGRTVEPLPADHPLEPVRGVVRDHPAVVDHGDLVGERVGLLQVLRGQQHRRAVADQAADHVPHVLALGRVEAGGRLVEEDHRRPADQATRRGRAGGACRRSRSWPTGSAASVRSNQLEQLGGARLRVAAWAGRAAGRS